MGWLVASGVQSDKWLLEEGTGFDEVVVVAVLYTLDADIKVTIVK